MNCYVELTPGFAGGWNTWSTCQHDFQTCPDFLFLDFDSLSLRQAEIPRAENDWCDWNFVVQVFLDAVQHYKKNEKSGKKYYI